jgi:hypothetical protein
MKGVYKIRKTALQTKYFTLAVILLVCGAMIYPLFRGPNLLIWTVLPKPVFWDMCRIPWNEKSGFLSVLAGSGPDCLWLLSGIFVLRGVWFSDTKTRAIYIALFYCIAAGYNAGQYCGIVPGTFDLFDLLTMSGVALTEGVIFNIFIKNKEKNYDEKES